MNRQVGAGLLMSFIRQRVIALGRECTNVINVSALNPNIQRQKLTDLPTYRMQ